MPTDRLPTALDLCARRPLRRAARVVAVAVTLALLPLVVGIGCQGSDFFPDQHSWETATRLRLDDPTIWGRAEVATGSLELARRRAIEDARPRAAEALRLDPQDPRLAYFGALWGGDPKVYVRRDAGLIDFRVAYQLEDLAAELANLPEGLQYAQAAARSTPVNLEVYLIDVRPREPTRPALDGSSGTAPAPLSQVEVAAVLLPALSAVVATHGGSIARVNTLEAIELEPEAVIERKLAFLRHLPAGTGLPLRLREVRVVFGLDAPGEGGVASIQIRTGGTGSGAAFGQGLLPFIATDLTMTLGAAEESGVVGPGLGDGESDDPGAGNVEVHRLDLSSTALVDRPLFVTDSRPAVLEIELTYADATRQPMNPVSVVLWPAAGALGIESTRVSLLDTTWAGEATVTEGRAAVSLACDVDLSRVHGYLINDFAGRPDDLIAALAAPGAIPLARPHVFRLSTFAFAATLESPDESDSGD